MEYLAKEVPSEALVDLRDENNNRITKTRIAYQSKRKRIENDENDYEDITILKKEANMDSSNLSAMNLRSNCKGECGLVEPGLPHYHHKRKRKSSTIQMQIVQENEFIQNSKTGFLSDSSFKKSANSTTTITKSTSEIADVIGSDHNHNFFDKNKSATSSPERQNSSTNSQADHLTQCSRIHGHYQEYLNLSQEEKDKSKTDYTYAHSFSYCSLVPLKERFSWIIPNMSRASVNHYSRALLDKESVSRKVVGNIPVSKLNQSTNSSTITEMSALSSSRQMSTKATRSVKSKTTEEHIMHSTPIRSTSRSGIHKAKFDYSDDDDDDEAEYLEQQVPQNGFKNKANNGVRRNATNIVTNFAPDDGQLSEEEEEITIIRRINRFFITTVRTIFGKKADDDNEVVDDIAETYRANNRKQITTTNRYQTITQAKSKRGNCLFWPLIFMIPILLSGIYYFYSGNNLNNLLGDLSQPSSSRFTHFFDRFKFGSSPSLDNFQDFSQFNIEIQSLKNEIQLMKDRYQVDPSSGLSFSSTGESAGAGDQDGPNFDEILDRLAKLELKITHCCQQSNVTNITETIESEVKHILDSKLYLFQAHYDKQLEKEIDKIKSHLMVMVRDHTENHMTTSKTNGSFDSSQIEIMIKNAISKYDADKTGEADYALESSGAWVVSTRCSETYELYSASYKLLGLTLWRSQNTPRVVIQSGVVPGECWCFKGAEGRIAFHLSSRIIPTAFTYEHIPKSLSRDGHIQSAPSKFIVYGLKSEDDKEPETLGEYKYSIDSHDPLQRFEVQDQQTALHTFRYIEIAVKSNHGHPDYTCLYRFRVHGTPVFDENK